MRYSGRDFPAMNAYGRQPGYNILANSKSEKGDFPGSLDSIFWKHSPTMSAYGNIHDSLGSVPTRLLPDELLGVVPLITILSCDSFRGYHQLTSTSLTWTLT